MKLRIAVRSLRIIVYGKISQRARSSTAYRQRRWAATSSYCRNVWFVARRPFYTRPANRSLRGRETPLMLLISHLICRVALIGLVLPLAPAEAQLSGHGGPIRALAISADGATALSGSFDTSAIRWSLRRNTAEEVLRLHESAVNAVGILGDDRAITAGADARIAIWTPGKQEPDAVSRGTQVRSLRSPCHPTARYSPRRHGITQFVYGRSQAAWAAQAACHACCRAIGRTSMVSLSRRTARRW